MKRIVNGVTYNTDTSTALGQTSYVWKEGDDEQKVVETLYQTRGGAFFVHDETTSPVWNEDERRAKEQVEHKFIPKSPGQANKWFTEGDIEVFNNPFGDPPEATAEAEPGETIYIRVPASLKRKVEETAKKEQVSGNVWAMRCLERCLAAGAQKDALSADVDVQAPIKRRI